MGSEQIGAGSGFLRPSNFQSHRRRRSFRLPWRGEASRPQRRYFLYRDRGIM